MKTISEGYPDLLDTVSDAATCVHKIRSMRFKRHVGRSENTDKNNVSKLFYGLVTYSLMVIIIQLANRNCLPAVIRRHDFRSTVNIYTNCVNIIIRGSIMPLVPAVFRIIIIGTVSGNLNERQIILLLLLLHYYGYSTRV